MELVIATDAGVGGTGDGVKVFKHVLPRLDPDLYQCSIPEEMQSMSAEEEAGNGPRGSQRFDPYRRAPTDSLLPYLHNRPAALSRGELVQGHSLRLVQLGEVWESHRRYVFFCNAYFLYLTHG